MKRWNATFKITGQEVGSDFKKTVTVEGSAIFEKQSDQTIVSLSGSYTLTELLTQTSPSACKSISTTGSGTIMPLDGVVQFFPDDSYVPTQVGYYGTGASGGTQTTTFSNCPPPTPAPITRNLGAGWLRIPFALTGKPRFFTSPDLLSFSDQYTETQPDSTTTFEWSFTRTN